MPEGNVKKIVDVCDQKNGQNRHQHISSPTSVTNIDVATISIRPIMFRLNSGIRIGTTFLCGLFFEFKNLELILEGIKILIQFLGKSIFKF